MSLFSYPIELCEVSDRGKLELFRERLEGWNDLLNGDETHSIAGQFADMMWQDAAWRSANEARRYSEQDGPTSSVAPLLAAMLDRGYVAGQVLAIGRLLEYSDPVHPKKGVVSLRRLLDEAASSRDLITRENFVSHDALPYDYYAVERAQREEALAQARDGVYVTSIPTSGPTAGGTARRQHQLFDELAGVPADTRKRGDLISEAFFEKVRSFLDDPVFEVIGAIRNKNVAHAADSFSRSNVSVLRTGLTMDEISRAHYGLFVVYQVLSVVLFGSWRAGAVPVPQYDQFEHLSEPFVREGRLGELRQFWDAHTSERDEWMSLAYHEVLS